MIYMAPESTNESGCITAPEPLLVPGKNYNLTVLTASWYHLLKNTWK